MKKNVIKKWAVVVVTGIFMTSLTGCGTKTGATEQVPESSNEVVEVSNENIETEVTETEIEIEDDAEVSDEFVGAEDENIVLYAEIAKYGDYEMDIFDYVEQPGTVNATENIPIYNVEGVEVGYIKAGASVFIPEGAESGAVSRFKNPIAEADYDYLYVFKDFVTDANEISLTAEAMRQRIIDDVLSSPVNDDVHYVFLDEKASDMEVYECNLQSVYTDELDLQYWIDEELTRDFNMLDYKTLYIECEDDVDGWITVKLYYKDEIDWTQIM